MLNFSLFKEQFAEKLKGHSKGTVESAYAKIVKVITRHINDVLYFGGHELVRIRNRFIIQKIGTIVTVITPNIKIIDCAYITSISERTFEDISDKNYDSAITKSRTLLKEVF